MDPEVFESQMIHSEGDDYNDVAHSIQGLSTLYCDEQLEEEESADGARSPLPAACRKQPYYHCGSLNEHFDKLEVDPEDRIRECRAYANWLNSMLPKPSRPKRKRPERDD